MCIDYEEVYHHAKKLAIQECTRLEDWRDATFRKLTDEYAQKIVDQIQEGWDE